MAAEAKHSLPRPRGAEGQGVLRDGASRAEGPKAEGPKGKGPRAEGPSAQEPVGQEAGAGSEKGPVPEGIQGVEGLRGAELRSREPHGDDEAAKELSGGGASAEGLSDEGLRARGFADRDYASFESRHLGSRGRC